MTTPDCSRQKPVPELRRLSLALPRNDQHLAYAVYSGNAQANMTLPLLVSTYCLPSSR